MWKCEVVSSICIANENYVATTHVIGLVLCLVYKPNPSVTFTPEIEELNDWVTHRSAKYVNIYKLNSKYNYLNISKEAQNSFVLCYSISPHLYVGQTFHIQSVMLRRLTSLIRQVSQTKDKRLSQQNFQFSRCIDGR